MMRAKNSSRSSRNPWAQESINEEDQSESDLESEESLEDEQNDLILVERNYRNFLIKCLEAYCEFNGDNSNRDGNGQDTRSDLRRCTELLAILEIFWSEISRIELSGQFVLAPFSEFEKSMLRLGHHSVFDQFSLPDWDNRLDRLKPICEHFEHFNRVCLSFRLAGSISTQEGTSAGCVTIDIEYGPDYPNLEGLNLVSINDDGQLGPSKLHCLQQMLRKASVDRIGHEQLYKLLLDASNLLGTLSQLDHCFDPCLSMDNVDEIVRQAGRVAQMNSSLVDKLDQLKYSRKRTSNQNKLGSLGTSGTPVVSRRTITLEELAESRLLGGGGGPSELRQFEPWNEYCFEGQRLALYLPQSSLHCFELNSMRVITQSVDYIAYLDIATTTTTTTTTKCAKFTQNSLHGSVNNYRVSTYMVNLTHLKRNHSTFFEQLFSHLRARLAQFQQETQSFVEQTKTRSNISHYLHFEIRYQGFDDQGQRSDPGISQSLSSLGPAIWFILVKEPLPEQDSRFSFSMQHLKRSMMFGGRSGSTSASATTTTTSGTNPSSGNDSRELSRVCLNAYRLLTELHNLHKFGYFHGEFDPGKIFLSEDGDVKLYDSYLGTILPVLVPSILEHDLEFLPNGSVKIREEYLVPEEPDSDDSRISIVMQNYFEDLPLVRTLIANDVFNFGMVVLALATDCDLLPVLPIVGNRDDYVAISRMLSQRMDNLKVVTSLKDFVQRCIDPDENNRCALITLFDHVFLLNYLQSTIDGEQNDPGAHSANLTDSQLEWSSTQQQLKPHQQLKGMSFSGITQDETTSTDTDATNKTLTTSYLNSSRFTKDFVILDKLGKGAFGSVYKVRHKLDNQVYAMKCVKIKYLDPGYRLTREVSNLSRLSHDHVVRYYCSWVEESDHGLANRRNRRDQQPPQHQKKKKTKDKHRDLKEDHDDDSDLTKIDAEISSDSSDSSFEIQFVDAENSGDHQPPETATSNSYTLTGDGGSSSSAFQSSLAQKKNCPKPDNKQKFLCIQMELCEKKTLRDLIDSKKTHSPAVRSTKYRIFREIIAGLLYIHKMDIIHRDLKPNNIFFDKNNHVKIGDFGLSCQGGATGGDQTGTKADLTHSVLANFDQQITGVEATRIVDDDDDDDDDVASTAEVNENRDQAAAAAVRHTLDLGTYFYTAPELYSGAYADRYYTNKIDMYSLGIIFFEMCYPFGTGSERDHVLRGLRRKEIVFPSDVHKFINEKELMVIRRLLAFDPMLRPSADELSLEIEGLASGDSSSAGAGGQTVGSLAFDERSVISKVIQRPTSFQFSYLLNALFNRTIPLIELMLYDYWPITDHRPVTFYRQQQLVNLASAIFSVYSSHYGGSDLSIPTLIPKNILFESPVVGKQRNVMLLDQNGTVLSLPYDLRAQIARFVSFTPYRFSFLCRSAVQKMFIKLTDDDRFHPKEELNASFDFIWPKHYSSHSALLYSELITFAANIVTLFRSYTVQAPLNDDDRVPISDSSQLEPQQQQQQPRQPTILFQLTNLTILFNLCQLLKISNLGYQAMIRVLAQNADTIQSTIYDNLSDLWDESEHSRTSDIEHRNLSIEQKPGYQTIRMAIKTELDNVQLQMDNNNNNNKRLSSRSKSSTTAGATGIIPIVEILAHLCFVSERSPAALLLRISSILSPHFSDRQLSRFLEDTVQVPIRNMATIHQLTEAYWAAAATVPNSQFSQSGTNTTTTTTTALDSSRVQLRFTLCCVLKETYYCNDIALIVTMANNNTSLRNTSFTKNVTSQSPFNVVAIGGRYDNLINSYYRFSRQAFQQFSNVEFEQKTRSQVKCGLGISFNIGKLAAMLHQSSSRNVVDDNDESNNNDNDFSTCDDSQQQEQHSIQSKLLLIEKLKTIPNSRLVTAFDVLVISDRTVSFDVVRLLAKLRARTIRVLTLPEADNLHAELQMVFQFAVLQKVDTILLVHSRFNSVNSSFNTTTAALTATRRVLAKLSTRRFHILSRSSEKFARDIGESLTPPPPPSAAFNDCPFCSCCQTTLDFSPYELVTNLLFDENEMMIGESGHTSNEVIDQIVDYLVSRNPVQCTCSESLHKSDDSDDNGASLARNWQSSRGSLSASLSCSPPPRRFTLSSIVATASTGNSSQPSGMSSQSSITGSSASVPKPDIVFIRTRNTTSIFSNRRTLANSINAFIVRNLPFLNLSTNIKVFAVELPIEILSSISISITELCNELCDMSSSSTSGNSMMATSPSINVSSGSSSPSSSFGVGSYPGTSGSFHHPHQALQIEDLFYRKTEPIISYYKTYSETIQETLDEIYKYLKSSLRNNGPFFFVLLSYSGARFKYQLVYKNF